MVDMAARLTAAWGEFSRPIIAGLAFITVGIGLKLALFPLHVWLPNAYAYAPSWVTAFLSATATKVAIYLLVRFHFSIAGGVIDVRALPIDEVIVVLSLAAIIIASLIAVFERNLKRLLAYSSVAQIGYITLGIGLANQAALTGGLVHVVNHALMKAALFLAAGAVFYRAHTIQLGELAGIGRRMPLTFAAFTIAGFGLVGTPGTSGFISKWYLMVGALDAGQWISAAAIVAGSLIALVYVGKMLEIVWLREPSPQTAEVGDPPLTMLAPLVILALATIYFGFDTEWTAGIAAKASASLLGGMR
jgi:multicomponent Na+:H+ antiporter subunit D